MKTSPSTRRGSEANILLVTLCTLAVIGIGLAAYLSLVTNQNQLVVRSQVWNTCMPVLEAGIEEALAHCNANYQTNLVSNGWSLSGSCYALTNRLADSYYE